jgi:hypothetical protein
MAGTAPNLTTKFLGSFAWRYAILDFTNVGEEMIKFPVGVILIAQVKRGRH